MSKQKTQPEAKAPEKTQPEAKAPEQPKAKQKSQKTVDPVKYARYTTIKLLELDPGTKLSDDVKAEIEKLEKELKGCSGAVSKVTKTAAIGYEKTVFIKGIPVPEEVEKMVKDAKATSYYFEKQ